MPEVPQSIDEILPAARGQAVKMVAHLTRLGDDLRRVEDRRRDGRHDAGAVALGETIAALESLIEAADAEQKSRSN